MNRTAAKTSSLASVAFTLILLGCSADIGQDAPQQAGRSGNAGSKGVLSGLAGAGAGAGGATAAGGTTAVGGTNAAAGAPGLGGSTAGGGSASGGAGGVNPWDAFGGFPFAGRDSIGFGLGGAWTRSDFENGFAGSDLWGFSGADGNVWNIGGVGGSRIWASP